jgi:photoactive yellow protein
MTMGEMPDKAGATAQAVDFDTARLAEAVERLPEAAIHALPFGAIRVNDEGVVVFYSKAEARLSGSGERPRLGLAFFSEIAPCMDTAAFRGRIEAARQAGRLDLEFGYVGDFADRNRELTVRIQSAAAGGYWIFMRREV